MRAALALLVALGGCTTLREVGHAPALSPPEIPPPVHHATYAPPAYAPAPGATIGPRQGASGTSLWRSRSLYATERARNVGDLLTVAVAIDDEGSFRNTTDRRRTNSSGRNLTASVETSATEGTPFAGGEVSFGGRTDHKGSGRTQRGEAVFLRVAAHVEAVLPGGNLLVRGTQEVLLNHELRRLTVTGIARPRDLTAANTVPYDRLASARISYGGRGRLTEVQQPPWGQQIVDVVAPL